MANLALQEESRQGIRQEVRDAIDLLSEKNRIVTILYYLSGYSYKEIADFLGIKRSTVDSRLKESGKYLREELASMVARELKSIRLPETTGGQSVQGIVYGTDGKTPLQNASVFARQRIRRRRDDINLYFGPVRTDERGHYKLADLPMGDLEVRASAQNFEGILENVTLRSGESYMLNFSLRQAAIITGKIETAEEAQQMFFRIESSDEYRGHGTVTPNPDGTYCIVLTRSVDSACGYEIVEKPLPPLFMEQQDQISSGEWQIADAEETTCNLHLRVKGYEPITIPNLRLQRGKETKNVNIRPVHGTGSVSGCLLDEQGNPVGGVELGLLFFPHARYGGDNGEGGLGVYVAAYGLDLPYNRLVPIAISQENGSFTFDDVIEGFHKVRPTPKTEGVWDYEHGIIAVPRGQAVKNINVIVKPNPTIYVTGKILEPDGVTPMCDAKLTHKDKCTYKNTGDYGGGEGTIETDAEGRYEIRNHFPHDIDTYEITLNTDDMLATHKIEEVEAGMRIEGLDFVMRKLEKKTPALCGRVLGYYNKKPVGHCQVEISGESGNVYQDVDSDSYFEVAELKDGEYTVRVVSGTNEFIRSDAKLLPESEAKINVVDGYGGEVTLYLPRGATISGKVFAENDGLLIQQTVNISRKKMPTHKDEVIARSFGHVCICTDGKYASHGLTPGTYVYRASSEGYEPEEQTIEVTEAMLFGKETSGFDFHLKYGGLKTISGIVTLSDGKKTAADVLVALFKGEVRNYETLSSDGGRFLFENLPIGKYTLLVAAPGFPSQTRTIEIKTGETVPEVKIRLVKGGTIRGRVVFPLGMSVPDNLWVAVGPEGIVDRTVRADAIEQPPVDSLLQTDQFTIRLGHSALKSFILTDMTYAAIMMAGEALFRKMLP